MENKISIEEDIQEGIKQITKICMAEDYITNLIKEHTTEVEMNNHKYYETVFMWNKSAYENGVVVEQFSREIVKEIMLILDRDVDAESYWKKRGEKYDQARMD